MTALMEAAELSVRLIVEVFEPQTERLDVATLEGHRGNSTQDGDRG